VGGVADLQTLLTFILQRPAEGGSSLKDMSVFNLGKKNKEEGRMIKKKCITTGTSSRVPGSSDVGTWGGKMNLIRGDKGKRVRSKRGGLVGV